MESLVRTRCLLSQSLDLAGRCLLKLGISHSKDIFFTIIYVEGLLFGQPASMCQDKGTLLDICSVPCFAVLSFIFLL